jgi:hypothetical protein
MTSLSKNALRGFISIVAVLGASLAIAQTPPADHRHKDPAPGVVDASNAGKHQPGMHMHKSDVTHSLPDAEAAKAFKADAAELRAMAASHRKLAGLYKGRTPPKGSANYDSVAKHCEQLAKSYEEAAKAADALSSELGKK